MTNKIEGIVAMQNSPPMKRSVFLGKIAIGLVVILLSACGPGQGDGQGLNGNGALGNGGGGAVGVGGGTGTCDRFDRSGAALTQKIGNCRLTSGLPTRAACQAAIAQCTTADQTAISHWLDCLDRVTACAPGQEQAFSQTVNNCAANLNVSPACLNAFGAH